MKLITFNLHDGRQIQINPEQVAYVIQYGENTDIGMGGRIATVAEPVGVVLNRLQEAAGSDGQIATAKAEAFEQMAQFWESKHCKMEAFEARRMAKELGL